MEFDSPPEQRPERSMDFGKTNTLAKSILILKRRWIIFVIAWATGIAGAGVYSILAKRTYRPQATIEIRPETPMVSTEKPDPNFEMTTQTLWENYYKTQEVILMSPNLHRATLKLLPKELQEQFTSERDPLKAFADLVDVEKSKSTFTMKVGFIHPSPESALLVVKTLVGLYLEESNRRLRELKSGAVALLSKEALPSIRENVDNAEKAVEKFLSEHGSIDPNDRYAILIDSRKRLMEKLTDLSMDEARLKSQLETLSTFVDDPLKGMYHPLFYNTTALSGLVTQLENTEALLSLERKNLMAEHPHIVELTEQQRQIQGRIRDLVIGTLRGVEADIKITQAGIAKLKQELKNFDAEVAIATILVAKYKRLDAEQTAAHDLYNAYLKKQGEIAAISGTGIGSVWVIDQPTIPPVPYKPNIPLNLSLGALAGLLIGTGAVFVVEQLSDRIFSSVEVETFLELETLSTIPRMLEAKEFRDRPRLMDGKTTLPEFEAFRNLRAAVITRMEHAGPRKMIAVLSSADGEGKSTVAANLARVLAMERRKVLLFDADLRRSSLYRLLSSNEGSGLEDVLGGRIDIEKAISPSRISGVDIIGMRAGTDEAPELANSSAFLDSLERVRKQYDYVVVDTAPINFVSESALIARRCDTSILVVRSRYSSRGACHAAIKRLEGMKANVLGAVFNCVSASDSYYYGYYYGTRGEGRGNGKS